MCGCQASLSSAVRQKGVNPPLSNRGPAEALSQALSEGLSKGLSEALSEGLQGPCLRVSRGPFRGPV